MLARTSLILLLTLAVAANVCAAPKNTDANTPTDTQKASAKLDKAVHTAAGKAVLSKTFGKLSKEDQSRFWKEYKPAPVYSYQDPYETKERLESLYKAQEEFAKKINEQKLLESATVVPFDQLSREEQQRFWKEYKQDPAYSHHDPYEKQERLQKLVNAQKDFAEKLALEKANGNEQKAASPKTGNRLVLSEAFGNLSKEEQNSFWAEYQPAPSKTEDPIEKQERLVNLYQAQEQFVKEVNDKKALQGVAIVPFNQLTKEEQQRFWKEYKQEPLSVSSRHDPYEKQERMKKLAKEQAKFAEKIALEKSRS